MSRQTDALAQVLFNKPSLQECSLQQVEYLAHQYPYFSTAQFLFLEKTERSSEAYAQQLQQTALHFSNPLQLQFWLDQEAVTIASHSPELFQTPIPESIESEPDEVTETKLTEAVSEPIDLNKPEATTEIAAAQISKTPPVHNEAAEEASPASEPEIGEVPANKTAANEPTIEAASLTFEPYHTVDYFASQGIKLSQQEAVNDKLGKQLKSFTEWLKTMKRLPEVPATQNTDVVSERKVENLAAHSLDTADVVTESMAEVWLKQGAKEKALDIYNKLRLRYPDKSAYFAAKIDALK